MKRLPSVILAVLLLMLPALLLGSGGQGGYTPSLNPNLLGSGGVLGDMEAYLARQFPYRDGLYSTGLSIRAFGGLREYNGIFISGDELIPDIDPPVESYVRDNTAAILEFAEAVGIPTYCMIVPTVSAIRQESLPQFTQGQVFNQKQFIEDVYSGLVGRVTLIDAYQTLFNARDQYIYYRTESNLTALGGYYLYTALADKMLEGIADRPALGDYDIDYVKHDYYGRLYDTSPFKDARADTLSLFRYSRASREYTVTHRISGGAQKTYHTLYPEHLLDLDREMEVYLGGVSAVTKTVSTSPFRTDLLVLGDSTALAYLPFLADQYRSVTLVDLFQLDAAGYQSLSLLDYDQFLFAYGIETFMHSASPARAVRLLPSLYSED